MSRNGRFGGAGTASLIAVDQAVSGGSNVLIALLAAQLLGVRSFGYFGIAFVVYTFVLGMSRALVSDPLLLHPADADRHESEILRTGLTVGCALGAILAVAACAVAVPVPALGRSLLILAACTPLLVLQDMGRYLAIARQRPGDAVLLDAVWLFLMIAAVAAAAVTERRTLGWFVASWGVAGSLAGLVVFTRYRVASLRPTMRWLAHTWHMSARFLVSYLAAQGTAVVVLSSVGAIAGAEDLGGFQGTLLVVRPYTLLQIALVASFVSQVARHGAGPDYRRRTLRLSAVLATAGVIDISLALLVPDNLGRLALGDSWVATYPLLLPTGLQVACLGLIAGLRAGLLGLRAVRTVMLLDLPCTVVVIVTTVSGAYADGARGALWFSGSAQTVFVVLWTIALRRHQRSSVAGEVPAASFEQRLSSRIAASTTTPNPGVATATVIDPR